MSRRRPPTTDPPARVRRRAAVSGGGNVSVFFFNDAAPTAIYTLSLHDALPISSPNSISTSAAGTTAWAWAPPARPCSTRRSEEHTSELQSHRELVCRLLLEKKKCGVAVIVWLIGSSPAAENSMN